MILCDKVCFIYLINLSPMVIQPRLIESDFWESKQVVVNNQVKINVNIPILPMASLTFAEAKVVAPPILPRKQTVSPLAIS